LLAACPYFATERWESLSTVESNSSPERFDLLVILGGTGYIHWSGSPPLIYEPGQCWFIPASLGTFSLQAEVKSVLIRTYVPDLVNLTDELDRSGVLSAFVSQFVFS
jgi:mannose-6-phosphate isomerase